MDDFREWLSDNLRYFELGIAAVAVVALAVWGVSSFLHLGGGKTKQETVAASVNEQAKTNEPIQERRQEAVEDRSSLSRSASNPLTVAESAITSLVRSYYQSVGDKDLDAVRALVDELSPEDEPMIKNSEFEDYVVDNVFTKNGLTDNERVVFVEYTYRISGSDTDIPASSWLYVRKDEQDVWRIVGNSVSDPDISAYLASLEGDSDVMDRTAKVQGEYDEALASDPDLNDYLNGLGEPSEDVPEEDEEDTPEEDTPEEDTAREDSSEPEEEREPENNDGEKEKKDSEEEDLEGTYGMVTNDYVNVRDAAGGGDIIGGLDEGVSIRAYGTDGEWTEIRYDGQVAYIYSEYLSNAE